MYYRRKFKLYVNTLFTYNLILLFFRFFQIKYVYYVQRGAGSASFKADTAIKAAAVEVLIRLARVSLPFQTGLSRKL